MRKIRLRELPHWPPEPGGAFDSQSQFPLGSETVVTEVFPVLYKAVTFRGIFEGRPHSYLYVASDEKTAQKIHEAIAANQGKTLAQLGELEIETEEDAKRAWGSR